MNREKSSIRHAAQATLLGFGFFFDGPQVGIWIAPKAVQRLKDQLRMLTRRRWSVPMDYRNWLAITALLAAADYNGRFRVAGSCWHVGGMRPPRGALPGRPD